MSKGRLEAFSDGVIAILITIMVLALATPRDATPEALVPLIPTLLSYLLSFVYLGIYWNNHHHLLQAARQVDGRVLWANLHLLFWLSLIPFVTAWVGAHPGAPWPTAAYGAILFLAGGAYFLLSRALIAVHGADSVLAAAIGRDRKGWASLVMYFAAIPLAFVSPLLSHALYVGVAIIWLAPDRRIERILGRSTPTQDTLKRPSD